MIHKIKSQITHFLLIKKVNYLLKCWKYILLFRITGGLRLKNKGQPQVYIIYLTLLSKVSALLFSSVFMAHLKLGPKHTANFVSENEGTVN